MLGSGTVGDPYIIQNVIDLQNMNNDLDAYYELGNDIDASATSGWNGGSGFWPIGVGSPFLGHFDGKGYTIDSLFVNWGGNDFIGLFGSIDDDVVIRNLSLTNISITGHDYVGGILGVDISDSFTLENCSVSGVVNGESNVGGVLGWSTGNDTAIRNVSCVVAVTSTDTPAANNSCGGFIGHCDIGGDGIKWCSATGNVISSGINVGGFVGQWVDGDIIESFATGNVQAGNYSGNSFAGGFSGYAGGDGLNCYAKGAVTGTGDYVGGFAGESPSTMDKCYSTGYVTGVGTNVGGLIGGLGGTCTNSYWDTETSGQSSSAGGTGKTTAQMKTQSTFTNWNFTTVWNLNIECNGGYPCLIETTPNCVYVPVEADKYIVTLEAVRNIEMSAMGRFYISKDGTATYESRYARNP